MRPSLAGCTALITGGAGFIGSHLADRLYAEGARQVVVIDNMFLGFEENLRQAVALGAVLYRDDAVFATSLEAIFASHSIDIVFNCATKALAHSFTNPANTYMVNPQVVINLLELQRRDLFHTLVHFSTSEVYGSAVYEPMDELHPIRPTTPYAAGKAAADLAVQTYVDMFGVDSFIVRPFNNYGPRQNHRGALAAVIPRTVERLVSGERPQIQGTGSQSRDFIYVGDTVGAVVKAYDRVVPGDAVNISADSQVTIKEVIEAICACANRPVEIDYQAARPCDVACHNGSSRKLKGLIEFELTPFQDGLKTTVEWYLNELDRSPG